MGRHCYDPNPSDYQLSAHMSHTADYPESNGPLQQYLLPSPVPFPIFIWGSAPQLGKSWTPRVPCPSHPHHPPCHLHATPPCHHCCFLLPSFLHTLPHPCCFACVPLLQTFTPPCKVSLQPINELAGLVLKWEALLQLKYFSDIPRTSCRTPDVQLRARDATLCIIGHLAPNLGVPMFSFCYKSNISLISCGCPVGLQTSDSAQWPRHFCIIGQLVPNSAKQSDVFPFVTIQIFL